MIDLRPDHLAIVRAILKAELPDEEVWAFGSRATWTARDTSDLDLVVVGDRPLSLSNLARLQQAFEESYLPFSVDVLDWSQLSEDFRSVILSQRVVLQEGRTVETGDAPAWRAVPLAECANFVSGGTPSRMNPEYWNGNIPWVTAKDMKQFRLHDTLEHVTTQAIDQGLHLVPAGTVLVLVRGMTLHKDLPICIIRRPMTFNQDVRALRPRGNVDSEYLSYALIASKPALLSLVDAASHGTGRIHSGSLASFPIALPHLTEQRAIAQILGALDDKIELNRRMNQTLEAMARAIFKSWFVDFDPVREGHPLFPRILCDSSMGQVPDGWSTEKLAKVVDINGQSISRDYPYEEIDYVDISSVTVGRLESTKRYKVSEAPSRAKQLVSSGDTIWSCVRPNRKSYLYLHNPPPHLVVSTGFAVLSPRTVPPAYLYSWVTTDEFVDYLVASADGSAYPAVRPSRFGEADVLVPSKSVLDEFQRIVGPLRERIALNEQESHILAALRDTLIPKLLSGEIRVKQAEKIVGEAV